jgi:transposase-like protein
VGPNHALRVVPNYALISKQTGEVIIGMLADVKQATIGPLIERSIIPGTVVYTDECDIYTRSPGWGSTYRSVCLSCAR